MGFEYPAMWAIGALYFLINGGGDDFARPSAAGL
jgi:hypothetical protein